MLFFFTKFFKNIFCNCYETAMKLRNCYETARNVVADLMTFLSSVKSSNLLNVNILHDKLTYYFLTFFLLFCQKVIYLYQTLNN